MMELISEVWWSDLISKDSIILSFKKGGIILNADGTEASNFNSKSRK